MRTTTGFLYRNILKPLLFQFPADDVHEFFLKTGKLGGKSKLVGATIKNLWAYKNPILSQTVSGISFPNPIGLSAGFDYNGDLVDILPDVGFGFHTVGTVTFEAYEGNTPPMLGRLPKSKSLLVNKGFKNKGIKNILPNLKKSQRSSPIGVSIGATNKPYDNLDEMIANLVAGFEEGNKNNNFDYFELNISCPNLINIKNLPELIASPTGLKKTLEQLNTLKIKKPVFIKMPSEKSFEEMEALVEIAKPFDFIKGLIFSNLVKDRSNPAFNQEEIKKAGMGNFSGKPVEMHSNKLIEWAYQRYKNRFTIIGVGGVFTAEDAYEKIKRGASLVQLITGMVYMGPQQIGTINKELAELLKKDGFKNIQEAIGTMQAS